MGALHAGHGALIRRSVQEAAVRGLPGGCVVWVFVNPTQFNNPADLARYPRTLEADAVLCEAAGAAAIFAPSLDEVYPSGVSTAGPALPAVATTPGLEDAFRPGHFAGVCQVVKRLFEMCRPAAAVFGEKDWQQLAVVRAMVEQERRGDRDHSRADGARGRWSGDEQPQRVFGRAGSRAGAVAFTGPCGGAE